MLPAPGLSYDISSFIFLGISSNIKLWSSVIVGNLTDIEQLLTSLYTTHNSYKPKVSCQSRTLLKRLKQNDLAIWIEHFGTNITRRGDTNSNSKRKIKINRKTYKR